MISSLSIQEFKCFGDQTISLNAMTLLAGANATGKSTVIQALLLLRQSHLRGTLPQGELLLNGPLVNVGTALDTVNEQAATDTVAFILHDQGGQEQRFAFDYPRGVGDSYTLRSTNSINYDANNSLFSPRFNYLNAERIGPRLIYPMSEMIDDLIDVGIHGEYTAHCLHRFGADFIKNSNLVDDNESSPLLLDQTRYCMREIVPDLDIDLKAITEADQQRADAQHKASHAIASTYAIIGVEDLHVAGLVKNRRLSRALSIELFVTRKKLTMPHEKIAQHAATKPLRLRASALVEMCIDGTQGVLIHADHHGAWLLPGGGREHYADGRREPLLAAAVRELFEETGMTAYSGFFFMSHRGTRNLHYAFVLHAAGTPTLVDEQEAPAFGLCLPDLRIVPLVAADGFTSSGFPLTPSSQSIISAYYRLKAEQPERFVLPSFALPNDGAFGSVVQQPADTAAHPTPTRRKRQAQVSIGPSLLELCEGDIVKQNLDAVVNAANSDLRNGGGVCGAIHEAAGVRDLEAACRQIGRCPVGDARLTPGFKLKARFIIHAVGPRYGDHHRPEAERLLASAYTTSLRLARKNGISSIAFPSLSTGIYGYPLAEAAPIALRAVIAYLQRHPEIRHVRFVLRGDSFDAYQHALP